MMIPSETRMERQVSHRHASSSGSSGIHAPTMPGSNKPAQSKRLPPNSSCLQRDLMSISFPELLKVAKQLKHAGVVTTLRLFVSLNEQHIVNQRFSSLDPRTTDAVFKFTRALSRAIEGWMHDVEIGLSLWNRDLKMLSEAFGYSKTLRRLSFANSGLGDIRLEILAGGLRDCMPLQTLDLSGCALTDASVRCITVIVKGHNLRVEPPQPPDEPPESWTIRHRTSKFGEQWRQNLVLRGLWSPAVRSAESAVTRKAELEWKASLREPVGRRCSSSHESQQLANKNNKKSGTGSMALAALDLSYNAFTDLLPRELVVALRMGAPLHALNLRFNQMTRVGAKYLLDVMHEFSILRLVDLRGNEDDKVLGVLENGEHYTSFSTFQAPFWLELTPPLRTPEPAPGQENMKPLHVARCNLAALLLRQGTPPPTSLPTPDAYNEVGTASTEGGVGTPVEEPGSESTQSKSMGWDRDWACHSSATPPGMIDPPREALVPEPPKMFTNELYEPESCRDNCSNSQGGQLGLRNTPRRSCAERANNKRKTSTDCQLRRRARRACRKSSPPHTAPSSVAPTANLQLDVARAKHVAWDVARQQQQQQQKKLCKHQPAEESLDVDNEVEWHNFVSEMTETLLTLRDGLDKLIGPTEDDDDMLFVTQQGTTCTTKLPQKLLGTARMYGSLDGQLKAVIHKPKKTVPEWKLVGTVHPQLQPQPCTPAKKSKNRL